MDQEEYRRMAEFGETHWWYKSTRALLRQLIEPHLDPGAADGLHLDAAGGTGATGAWLTESAPTVLADYEHFALAVAAEEHPRYIPVCTDLNHMPFASGSFSTILCVTALCHRMNANPAAIVEDFARLSRP